MLSDSEMTLAHLDPVFLLVSLYNGFDGSLRYHCGPIRGEYRRQGDDIAFAKCANCDRTIAHEVYPPWTWVPAIEGHPETETKRARLLQHGVVSKFSNYQDPGMDARVFSVLTTPATMQTVRKLAKLDLGIESLAADSEFDRRFNLYFNQNYAFDWKEWRARFPKEHWPVPRDGWAQLLADFSAFQSS